MDFQIKSDGIAKISINALSESNGIELYEVKAIYPEEQAPEKFSLVFSTPNKYEDTELLHTNLKNEYQIDIGGKSYNILPGLKFEMLTDK